MATLLQLTQGTQKVSPITIGNANSVGSMYVNMININNFDQMRTKLCSANIRSQDGKRLYKTIIQFVDVTNPETDKLFIGKSPVLCHCSCDMYYYYCWYANKKAGCHYGKPLKPYYRKTPPPPQGRDFRNPDLIPCMCKHQILLAKYLQQNKIVI